MEKNERYVEVTKEEFYHTIMELDIVSQVMRDFTLIRKRNGYLVGKSPGWMNTGGYFLVRRF
jgi:hypothetical protein